MATYNKYQQFVEDLAKKVINLDTDTLKVLLSNTAPNAATNTVKADAAEISAGNGYTAGGATIGGQDAEQTGGVLSLVGNDVTFTASGGPIGPFRYAIFYDDTPTSPADPLIAWWDYGSSITLADGESFVVDFASTILTIT